MGRALDGGSAHGGGRRFEMTAMAALLAPSWRHF